MWSLKSRWYNRWADNTQVISEEEAEDLYRMSVNLLFLILLANKQQLSYIAESLSLGWPRADTQQLSLCSPLIATTHGDDLDRDGPSYTVQC